MPAPNRSGDVGRGFVGVALVDLDAVFDLVAGVEDDLVAFGEAFRDFGFDAILAADLYFLHVDDAVLHLKHGRVFADAE